MKTLFALIRQIPLPLVLATSFLYGGSDLFGFDFRAVNMTHGDAAIDVHFDDRETPSISGLAVGYASQVLSNLPSGQGDVNVKFAEEGAGVGSAFVESDLSPQTNYEHTSVVYGQVGDASALTLDRNRALFPNPGNVMVRVVHIGDFASDIDVYFGSLTGSPLFQSISSGSSSQFNEVEAQATSLILAEAGSPSGIARLTAPLGSGSPFVTLIVTGTSTDDVVVYAMTDFDDAVQELTLLKESSYTNIRAVHLRSSPGSMSADSVDVYFNKASQSDAKVTDSLGYLYVSRQYGPLTADSFRMKFVPVGESPSSSILQYSSRFGNDTAYVVIMSQFTDGGPTPVVLKRSPVEAFPPGIGSSHIRIANASAFNTPLTAVVHVGTDTVRRENISFKTWTDFVEVPTSVPFSIDLYEPGSVDPVYSGNAGLVPSAAYLTILLYGNEEGLSAGYLNESQAGRHRLTVFNESNSVPYSTADRDVEFSVVPNPARTQSASMFHLERRSRVALEVYDVQGRIVEAVQVGSLPQGDHSAPLPESLERGHYRVVLLIDGVRTSVAALIVLE